MGDTKVPMGYGFVEFYSGMACSRASMEDNCELDGQLLTLQVSRPPKDIHAIITQAGMTDANGNLLIPVQSQPVPQMFQGGNRLDPATGQFFVGDVSAAHLATASYPQPAFPAISQAGLLGQAGFMMPQTMMPTPLMVQTNPLMMGLQNPALLQQQQQQLAIQQLAFQQQQLALQQTGLQNVDPSTGLPQLGFQTVSQPSTPQAGQTQILPSQTVASPEQPNVGLPTNTTEPPRVTTSQPRRMPTAQVPQQLPSQSPLLTPQTQLSQNNVARLPNMIPQTSMLQYQTPTNQKLLQQAAIRPATHHTQRFTPY